MVLCTVIHFFKSFSIMASNGTRVFSIAAYYEPNIYSQCYLILCLHVFREPKTFRTSGLHTVIRLSPIYQFFFISLVLSFRIVQNFSEGSGF